MAVRGDQRERLKLAPLIMLLAVFVAYYVCALTILTPEKYSVRAGDMAPGDITAPRTSEDAAATEALRELARNETKTVYMLDEALIETYVAGANAFFTEIDAFRRDAADIRLGSTQDVRTEGSLSINEWKSVMSEAELQTLMGRFSVPITIDEGWWLLYADKSELLRLQDAVLPKLTTSLESGLEEASIKARKTAYVQELFATSISDTLKAVGEKVLDTYLKATHVEDEQATNQARESAAAAVPPVEIKRGDVIVQQGGVISQQQYDIMRQLELIRADNADMYLNIGLILYILSIGGCFVAYLFLYKRKNLTSVKDMLIVSVAAIISILLAFVLNALDKRISTSLIAVLLIALLVDRRVAMAVNIMLALFLGLLSGGRGSSMMSFDAMVMACSVFAGGQFAIYMLRRYYKRGTIITAGMVSGAAAALMAVAAHVMTAKTPGVVFLSAAWAFGSNAIAAVLVVGTLPLFENLFDVATSARLNELSNANNPLLRQLMTEAPGTYHHSMMTAALAESAAEAIEADALLARVGAYYHDVGKLRRPIYFKENQKPNENIHDTLPPGESATIIIAHQKDSVQLLTKHKLPSAVVQIAFEHHGTTMAAYFYHKAVKDTGKQLPQKLFRYPGARPGTKESAIVMLADSCEAAVRSLSSPNREQVEQLVDKIIKGKIEDGQLALSPLNFREVTLIQQSFMRTFTGMLHERIAYPDQLKPEEKKR